MTNTCFKFQTEMQETTGRAFDTLDNLIETSDRKFENLIETADRQLENLQGTADKALDNLNQQREAQSRREQELQSMIINSAMKRKRSRSSPVVDDDAPPVAGMVTPTTTRKRFKAVRPMHVDEVIQQADANATTPSFSATAQQSFVWTPNPNDQFHIGSSSGGGQTPGRRRPGLKTPSRR